MESTNFFMQTEEKTVGIVVASNDFGENDKIITLCTFERGKISAMVKGCKKQNARLKLASSLFCFGEFKILNAKYSRVIEFNCIESFFRLTQSLKKFYLSCAICETLKIFMKEEELYPEAVSEAVNALKNIEEAEGAGEEFFFIRSFLKLLSCFGYGIEGGGCSVCGKKPVFFSFENGLCCEEHKAGKGEYLSEKALFVLEQALSDNDFSAGVNDSKTKFGETLEKLDSNTVKELFFILRHYFYFCSDKPNLPLKTYFKEFIFDH